LKKFEKKRSGRISATESSEALIRKPIFATKSSYDPTANSVRSLRRNIRPPEIAGDAMKRSPNSFSAKTSGVRPARNTNVVPVSLTR
jgi:hypothetical protein